MFNGHTKVASPETPCLAVPGHGISKYLLTGRVESPGGNAEGVASDDNGIRTRQPALMVLLAPRGLAVVGCVKRRSAEEGCPSGFIQGICSSAGSTLL